MKHGQPDERTTSSRKRSDTPSRSSSRSFSRKRCQMNGDTRSLESDLFRFSPCFAICSMYSFARLSRCSCRLPSSSSSAPSLKSKLSKRMFPLADGWFCASSSSMSLSLGISSFSSMSWLCFLLFFFVWPLVKSLLALAFFLPAADLTDF